VLGRQRIAAPFLFPPHLRPIYPPLSAVDQLWIFLRVRQPYPLATDRIHDVIAEPKDQQPTWQRPKVNLVGYAVEQKPAIDLAVGTEDQLLASIGYPIHFKDIAPMPAD